MAQKPSIPKGTRDFGQVEMARRNYIFNTIKSVFSLYGFQQIETPAMENLSTLMGKYGEEGDKLLFRIQNSGEKANLAPEKGLRYDLTVPFARYVVQHREEISFPFKRFQIQPVWRADRPQKGRYREFYQTADAIRNELKERGLSDEQVEALQPILNQESGIKNQDKLASLKEFLAGSEIGLKGVEEMEEVFDLIEATGVKLNIELDLCLARGLNYYTGAIFEVKALDAQIGSITGGGRYDNLTGIFGLPGVSGVGISFGADRIYDVLTELDLFPKELQSATQILFAAFGEEELHYALRWAKELRAQNIAVEVYPEPTKMKKQMGYADSKQIPFVAIVGSDEMAQNKVMVKNMSTGEQQLVTLDELLSAIKN